jgi:hypothetical protein
VLKTYGRNEGEGSAAELTCDHLGYGSSEQHGPVLIACDEAETECMR